MKRSLYEVLEVSPTASPETIRAAYKSLLQRYHPDKHPGNPRRAARAQEMIDAYQVLSDARARFAYDRQLSAISRPTAPAESAKPPRPAEQPKTTPAATPPLKSPAARPWRAAAWGACLILMGALSGFLLLPQFDRGPQAAPESDAAAAAGAEAPMIEASNFVEQGPAPPEISHALPELRDWLIAYRSLDQNARAAEVRRLVNNGSLALVQGEGRFFRDPRALRNAYPVLFDAPTALEQQDAAALESLQSWWLAPQQLDLLLLNDFQPARPLSGLIFELASGSCLAADSVGAVAVDLGKHPLQPGEAALVQIPLPDLPPQLYTAHSCGTIVSRNYGSVRMMPGS